MGGGTYTLVVRGDFDDRLAYLFNGMELVRIAGTTILSCSVVDQAQLHGHLARVDDLGLELVLVKRTAEAAKRKGKQ